MDRRPSSPVVRALTAWGWGFAAVCLLALPGCSGCSWWSNAPPTVAEEDKTKPKPKPDFELSGGSVVPYNLITLQSGYKPGHWTTAVVDGVANNFDMSQGRIVTDPVRALDMPYLIGASQSIALPKGQKRRRELTFFVPPRYDDQRDSGLPRKQVPILFRLQPEDGWRTLASDLLRVRPLENYQYYFLVLAANTEPNQYWERLPSMQCHAESIVADDVDKGRGYLVVIPPIARQVPVPSTSLSWTSIAYVAWDGLAPDLLTEAQQRAMIDWLHWGGQLVVSGPDSLAALEKSPLAKYLPATAAATRDFSPQDLADFRTEWWPNRELPPVKARWSGVALAPHERARVVVKAGEAPLVVERDVGRGRVVVTAFRLTEPEYVESIARDDSFVNGVLMRRPPRSYFRENDGNAIGYRWADASGYPAAGVLSPAIASRVEFFSRDADPRKPPEWARSVGEEFRRENQDPAELVIEGDYTVRPRPLGGENDPPRAAWSDFNGVSSEARAMLIQASGIKVPDRSFVVMVMGVYLIILVPLNWLVFRAINRVEWAWAAAPVITICYALAVVKLAEVNVGFARPRNDVAVVEVQPGYSRAHLTRYTSLYASLFTSYDLKFDDESALVQPLADGRRPAAWQARPTLTYSRDGDAVSMNDFEVASNSLSMLHSEQMFDLGGTVDLEIVGDDGDADGSSPVYRVVNNSRRTLRDAHVYAPADAAGSEFDGASASGVYFDVGTLEPGRSAILERERARPIADFRDAREVRNEAEVVPARDRGDASGTRENATTDEAGAATTEGSAPTPAPVAGESSDPNEFTRGKLDGLWRVARVSRPEKEWRLVAWSNEVLPGMEATPTPQVHREANLFVVRLAGAPTPEPRPDAVPRSTIPREFDLDLTPPMDPNAAFDPNAVVAPAADAAPAAPQ